MVQHAFSPIFSFRRWSATGCTRNVRPRGVRFKDFNWRFREFRFVFAKALHDRLFEEFGFDSAVSTWIPNCISLQWPRIHSTHKRSIPTAHAPLSAKDALEGIVMPTSKIVPFIIYSGHHLLQKITYNNRSLLRKVQAASTQRPPAIINRNNWDHPKVCLPATIAAGRSQ